MAAITRQADAGDASLDAWLRADPVTCAPTWVARALMASANLGLSAAEAELPGAAAAAVRRRAAFRFPRPRPSAGTCVCRARRNCPQFTPPGEGLGEDLLAHLPDGPEGRRWRDAAQRSAGHAAQPSVERRSVSAAGKLPVNSLWFWGGGVLPDSVDAAGAACVISEDHRAARAGEAQAGVSLARRETGSAMVDLRRVRDWAALEREQLRARAGQPGTRHDELLLDFADGASFRIERRTAMAFLAATDRAELDA